MERGVKINGRRAYELGDVPELPLPDDAEEMELGGAEEREADDFVEQPSAGFRRIAPSTDLGPCLYLGPAGQRCDARATEGAFCARHQPGASRFLSGVKAPKKAIAAAGIAATLWPVLADLIRELVRLLR